MVKTISSDILMSLVTLKRKSRRYKAPISGRGHNGFSLNGGYRNQGWVGQGSLGRNVSHTPYRGVAPMGNGGTGGRYPRNIIKGGPCPTNDPDYIKRSNMNTPGLISATVTHPTAVFNPDCSGSCAINWVQKFDPLTHAQGMYIREKSAKAMCVIEADDAGYEDCHDDCKSNSYFIGGKKIVRPLFSKSAVSHGAIPSSEYAKGMLLRNKCLPPPPCKAPFPMPLNHIGQCDINYLTPEEAIADGALPHDWMICKPGTEPGHGKHVHASFTYDFVFKSEPKYSTYGARWLGDNDPFAGKFWHRFRNDPDDELVKNYTLEMEAAGFSLYDETNPSTTKNGFAWANRRTSYYAGADAPGCNYHDGTMPVVSLENGHTQKGRVGTPISSTFTDDGYQVMQIMTFQWKKQPDAQGEFVDMGRIEIAISGVPGSSGDVEPNGDMAGATGLIGGATGLYFIYGKEKQYAQFDDSRFFGGHIRFTNVSNPQEPIDITKEDVTISIGNDDGSETISSVVMGGFNPVFRIFPVTREGYGWAAPEQSWNGWPSCPNSSISRAWGGGQRSHLMGDCFITLQFLKWLPEASSPSSSWDKFEKLHGWLSAGDEVKMSICRNPFNHGHDHNDIDWCFPSSPSV